MLDNNSSLVSPPERYFKKTYPASIAAKTPLINKFLNDKRLTQAIHRWDLTTILENLATSGITDNLAIFILANLQCLEVAS